MQLVQAVDRPEVLIVKSEAIRTEDLEKNDARNVHVKYLIDERHGSNRFSLRVYSIRKGGHTPLDRHEYEHHVYVLSGKGILRNSDNSRVAPHTVQPGDAIFIPSNAVHQFINNDDDPLVFLCVKGNPRLYDGDSKKGKLISKPSPADAC
jgi:quercetin dioxygenase-like cupin family protein